MIFPANTNQAARTENSLQFFVLHFSPCLCIIMLSISYHQSGGMKFLCVSVYKRRSRDLRLRLILFLGKKLFNLFVGCKDKNKYPGLAKFGIAPGLGEYVQPDGNLITGCSAVGSAPALGVAQTIWHVL